LAKLREEPESTNASIGIGLYPEKQRFTRIYVQFSTMYRAFAGSDRISGESSSEESSAFVRSSQISPTVEMSLSKAFCCRAHCRAKISTYSLHLSTLAHRVSMLLPRDTEGEWRGRLYVYTWLPIQNAAIYFALRNSITFDVCITSLLPMNWPVKIKRNFLKCAKFGLFNSITLLQTEFEDYVDLFLGYNDKIIQDDMKEFFDYLQGNFCWAVEEGTSGPSGYLQNSFNYALPRIEYYPLTHNWFPQAQVEDMEVALLPALIAARTEIDFASPDEVTKIIYYILSY